MFILLGGVPMRKKVLSIIDCLFLILIVASFIFVAVSIWGADARHREFQESVRRTKLNIILVDEMNVGESGWIQGKAVYNNKARRLCWLERKAEVWPKKDANHLFRLTRNKYAYEIVYRTNTDDLLLWNTSDPNYAPPLADYFPLRVIRDDGSEVFKPYKAKEKSL